MKLQVQHSAGHPVGHKPEPVFEPRQPSRFWTSKTGLVTIGFLLIAAFFLFSEHRAHTLGVLPFLLLAACPLLHMVMHRGHQGHGGHGRHAGHKEIEPTEQNGSKRGKGA